MLTNITGSKEDVEMRKTTVWMLVIGLVLVFSGAASAQQALIDSVAKGCDKELTTYCKDVTPGEGRGLACLYAYSDKLSAKCEYGLFEASAQLERFTKAVNYAATECRDDLKTYCADIKPGEGRLLQCIDKNAAKVSKR